MNRANDGSCYTTRGENVSKPKIVLHPKNPERVCWGCEKYCSADDLRCGNGTIRTQHPVELFGEDWLEWELAQCVDKTPCLTEDSVSAAARRVAEGEHNL